MTALLVVTVLGTFVGGVALGRLLALAEARARFDHVFPYDRDSLARP